MTYIDAAVRPAVRLSLCQILEQCAGYQAHEYHLLDLLDASGLKVGSVLLRGELQWLGDQDLVQLAPLEDAFVATLTDAGRDVAQGRAFRQGIARPRPGH